MHSASRSVRAKQATLAYGSQPPGPPEPVVAIPSVIGSYEIGELLGGGGMGEVYAGRHVGTGREVAIKLLHPQLMMDAEAVARFKREAKHASSVSGRHGVRVFDVGIAPPGLPYIVMERLRGIDLADLLDARGRLEIEESVRWVIDTCEAMSEAHAQGVIHRDLKPSNLYLADTPHGPVLKVLDFGLARAVQGSARLTATHTAVGTPHYMSPEQAQGAKTIDTRTDIWSLGVILYELLTGTVPFHGDSTAAVAISICTRTPEPPSAHRPEIPAALDELVLATLQRDPERRPETLAVLARGLRALLRDSVSEPPPRRSSRPTPLPAATPKMTPIHATMVMSRPASGALAATPVRERGARYAFAAALGGLTLGLIGSVGVLVLRPAAASEQVVGSVGHAAPITQLAAEPAALTTAQAPATSAASAASAAPSAEPQAPTTAQTAARPAAPVVTARSPWAALSATPTAAAPRRPRFDERK